MKATFVTFCLKGFFMLIVRHSQIDAETEFDVVSLILIFL